MRVSLFGSAVGSVCLAMLDDNEIERLAERARIAPSRVPAIRAEVAGIREEGHAHGVLDGSSYWSLAMPLAVKGMGVPSVLGLAGPADEVLARLPELRAIMGDVMAGWLNRAAADR